MRETRGDVLYNDQSQFTPCSLRILVGTADGQNAQGKTTAGLVSAGVRMCFLAVPLWRCRTR